LTRKSIAKIIELERAYQYSQHHLYSLTAKRALPRYTEENIGSLGLLCT
jgi:hypothetical protein